MSKEKVLECINLKKQIKDKTIANTKEQIIKDTYSISLPPYLLY